LFSSTAHCYLGCVKHTIFDLSPSLPAPFQQLPPLASPIWICPPFLPPPSPVLNPRLSQSYVPPSPHHNVPCYVPSPHPSAPRSLSVPFSSSPLHLESLLPSLVPARNIKLTIRRAPQNLKYLSWNGVIGLGEMESVLLGRDVEGGEWIEGIRVEIRRLWSIRGDFKGRWYVGGIDRVYQR